MTDEPAPPPPPPATLSADDQATVLLSYVMAPTDAPAADWVEASLVEDACPPAASAGHDWLTISETSSHEPHDPLPTKEHGDGTW